jgi:hypothetical protein
MKNIQEESKFKRYLYNEITAVVALISLTVGVIGWVKTPDDEMTIKTALIEQRLQTIETNHLAHMQTSLETLEIRMDNIEKNIATILALLTNAEIK